MGYTVFVTYLLESSSGYSTGIHCNYIQTIPMDTDNPSIMEINISFSNPDDFKFLGSITSGTGYTAQKIYAVIQVVSGMTNVTPSPAQWYKFDITNQITGHISGSSLTAAELTSVAFKVSLFSYGILSEGFIPYDLSYLNYPSASSTELCFGDEVYFLGNVTTDIHADVYVTDLSVLLDLNEFNSSTNKTWDSTRDKVSITEIGIYDDSTPKNLVAIGKLNSPLTKDSSIARTILFALDF
jgi:hypothetical protein